MSANSVTRNHHRFVRDALVVTDKKMQFGDSGEYISGDGTDLTMASGGDITLDADGGNITLDVDAANAFIYFKNDGDNFGWLSSQASYSILKIYEKGGATTDDYFQILVGDHGSTSIWTEDDASNNADLNFNIDGNIQMSSATGVIKFTDDGGTTPLQFTESGSGDWTIRNLTSDKDIIFNINDGGANTEVMRLDGDEGALLMAAGKRIMFSDTAKYIKSNGTSLQLVSGANILCTPGNKVYIDKNTTATTSGIVVAAQIDYDHTGITADAQTIYGKGLDLDMNCSTVIHVGHVHQTGIDIDMLAAADSTQTNTGIDISCIGANNNYGINITVPDEDGDYHMKLMAADDVNDYATFAVANTGDMTIATVGSGVTDSDLTLDVDGDIILDADGGNITMKDKTMDVLNFVNANGTWTIKNETSDADIIFNVNDGDVDTVVMKLDGSTSSLQMASGKQIIYGAAEEYISGDGTDLTIASGGDIILDAVGSDVLIKNDGSLGFKFRTMPGSGSYLSIFERGGTTEDDFFQLRVLEHGATYIYTIDDSGATAADLSFDIAGDITLDAATGTIKLLDNGSTYTPSASSDVANKGYVDAKRYAVSRASQRKMSLVNTWYISNQNFGTSITASDWATSKFNYAQYNSIQACTLKSWTLVGEFTSSVDYEVECWDLTIPANGTSSASTATKVGDTQSVSATAYAIYTLGQSDLSYAVAAGHSLYVLLRYTSGSGGKSSYESITMEFESL